MEVFARIINLPETQFLLHYEYDEASSPNAPCILHLRVNVYGAQVHTQMCGKKQEKMLRVLNTMTDNQALDIYNEMCSKLISVDG